MAKINCAIYVRKSTEKGLDQEFNSLHNQEQACYSYIMSQAFNNWEHYKTYIDGGISGGTMERPALQEMLEEIKKGNIQTVVVYKVDRLSRSIMDFHNMMKELEKFDCNFVSITQAFDTSTSMGKLTLNMLLSFAQFEREVSSERVRDKIHASKAKGLWMGSYAPLGYDVIDKKLVPNKEETETVKYIFELYLKSISLNDLRLKLIDRGIKNKAYKTKAGDIMGGTPLSSNNLARLLHDVVYIGKISNKKSNEVFDGQHKAVIDKELWQQVQDKIKERNRRGHGAVQKDSYLLHKKIMSADGTIFKNMKTSKTKNRLTYRYYTMPNFYLPAGDIDNVTREVVQGFLDSDMTMLPQSAKIEFKQTEYTDRLIKPLIDKIIYHDDKLTYFINIDDVGYLKPFKRDNYLNSKKNELKGTYLSEDKKHLIIDKPITIQKGAALLNTYTGKGKSIITKTENANALIKAMSIAWKYKQMYEEGISAEDIMKKEKIASRTVYKYLNLVYLSPRIINSIMDSEVPAGINLQKLFEIASKYDSFKSQEKAFFIKRM